MFEVFAFEMQHLDCKVWLTLWTIQHRRDRVEPDTKLYQKHTDFAQSTLPDVWHAGSYTFEPQTLCRETRRVLASSVRTAESVSNAFEYIVFLNGKSIKFRFAELVRPIWEVPSLNWPKFACASFVLSIVGIVSDARQEGNTVSTGRPCRECRGIFSKREALNKLRKRCSIAC